MRGESPVDWRYFIPSKGEAATQTGILFRPVLPFPGRGTTKQRRRINSFALVHQMRRTTRSRFQFVESVSHVETRCLHTRIRRLVPGLRRLSLPHLRSQAKRRSRRESLRRLRSQPLPREPSASRPSHNSPQTFNRRCLRFVAASRLSRPSPSSLLESSSRHYCFNVNNICHFDSKT